jgi:RimJ/RimL family protein N-acetyltransferase
MRTLRTNLCTLEPQVVAHAAEMFEVLSDPAIYEFEGVPPPSVERLANGYKLRESRVSTDGREKWLNWVVRLPTGELTGYVQATVLQSGASYVAYEFASKHWRKGIGRASVTAMVGELIGTHNVSLLVAVLKTANYRSMGLLRSLGFQTGTIEDAKTFEAEVDESVMVKHAHSAQLPPDRAQHASSQETPSK